MANIHSAVCKKLIFFLNVKSENEIYLKENNRVEAKCLYLGSVHVQDEAVFALHNAVERPPPASRAQGAGVDLVAGRAVLRGIPDVLPRLLRLGGLRTTTR